MRRCCCGSFPSAPHRGARPHRCTPIYFDFQTRADIRIRIRSIVIRIRIRHTAIRIRIVVPAIDHTAYGKLYQDAKLLIFQPTQAIILKISCKATIFQRKPQHHQVPAKILKFFDRLTPVMPRLSFCRFAPALRASRYATSTIALYAATLCALTILPRKARREPTFEPHSKHRYSHPHSTHRHSHTHRSTRDRPHGLMPN